MTLKLCQSTLRLALMSCACVSTSIAQQASLPGSEAAGGFENLAEIIVTATRHEAPLSKVPISVSAFSQDSMDTRGVKDFTDLVRFTPGVAIDAGGTNAISIRGIASSGGAGTTGIYIDDTPIQLRAIGFNPDDTLPKTFDLERVEVLRGPQGTLFGAGSEGGTVRYILPQPSLTTNSTYGKSEISYTEGGSANYEAGIAQGGPVIENVLGFRASAWYRRDGGWIDQIDPTTGALVDKNANHEETVVLRLSASWRPAENILVTPGIIYQDRRRNNISDYWPFDSNPRRNDFRSADPSATREPDKYYLPSLKMTVDFNSMQLISNTSTFRRKDLSGYEGTLNNLGYYQNIGFGTGYPTVNFLNPSVYPLFDATGVHLPQGLTNYRSPARITNRQDNFTQEVRLQSADPSSRWIWTAGLFFEANREQSTEEINDPMQNQLFESLFGTTATAAYGIPLLPNNDAYVNNVISHDHQFAGFAETTFAITDAFKLIAGARYSRTSYSFTQNADGPQNGGPSQSSGNQSEKPFTPKLGVTYQIDPDNLLYATYAKGFRIGGANAQVPLPSLGTCGLKAEPGPYGSDNTSSYEIGAKNKLFDKARLASSLYYIRWNKIQQTVFIPTCGLQYTANEGTAVAKGFDVQADLDLGNFLTLQAAIGYTDARYTSSVSNNDPVAPRNIVNRGDAIIGESGLPGAPWTASVGPQLGFNIFEHKSFARLDYQWQSHNRWDSPFTDPTTTQYYKYKFIPSSTTFVSFRAGSKIGDWQVETFIDNLLDSHTITNFTIYNFGAAAPPPLVRDYTFRPRTFGLTFIYRH